MHLSSPFSGARLAGAGLSGANLAGAAMIDIDLTGADLRNADLSDVLLRNANVSGAVVYKLYRERGWSTASSEEESGTRARYRPFHTVCTSLGAIARVGVRVRARKKRPTHQPSYPARGPAGSTRR
jgi:uncharacterized protein YjbI with pentapeptide repeats